MDKLTLAFMALWTFLFLYGVLAAIDFGAGFLFWWAGLTGRNSAVQRVVLRYLSPVWETTNVFLIFFVVGMVGYFPRAATTFGVLLFVPLGVALMLILLRGAFFAFHHLSEKGQRLFPLIFGISSLLIPVFLVPFLAVWDNAKFVSGDGPAQVSVADVLLNPLSVALMLVAGASLCYLASLLLSWYAARAGEAQAFRYFHRLARGFAPLTLLGGALLGVALHFYAGWHEAALLRYWPLHLLAALSFAGAWLLLLRRPRADRPAPYGLALLLSIAQYGLVFYALGLSHLPYLLYPSLTLSNTATDPAMFTALTVTVIGGSILLIPSLLLLYGLFLKPGRKAQKSERRPEIEAAPLQRGAQRS
jgi:cytochrome d ubiquinol oxidase subunit II